MGSRKSGATKAKRPCERLRDADRKCRSASGDPAMVLMFRMAAILSQVTGTLPVTPSGRIATGRSRKGHDIFVFMSVCMPGFESRDYDGRPIMQKRAL